MHLGSGSAAAVVRLSQYGKGSSHKDVWAPSDSVLLKKVNVGPGFEKQTNRIQAVYGKLRSDVPMTKMLLATDWGQGGRDWYDGAADSMHKPHITRPSSSNVGVPFGKQLSRKEAVVGKLLNDVAMTRMLTGTDWSQGGDHLAAEAEIDTFLKPPPTRKRAFLGQHHFNKQIGRVEYHVAGLRGAPAKPNLGEKVTHHRSIRMQAQEDARAKRAMSAPPNRHSVEASRSAAKAGSSLGRPTSAVKAVGDNAVNPFATITDIPQRPKAHVRVPTFEKQMPRERWTQQPMRLLR